MISKRSLPAVLSHVEAEALQRITGELLAAHAPIGPTEEMLVLNLAHCQWRMLRARRMQAAYLEARVGDDEKAGARVRRFVASAERSHAGALKDLRRTQALRSRREKRPGKPVSEFPPHHFVPRA
ncbi:MAG: hypothetical protein ABI165_18945 [Bryobacteraceae bacterium]